MADVALPVRVAAVDDYEIIVEGVAGMLRQFPDRLVMKDRVIIGEPIRHGPIDVALFDTYGRVGIAAPALSALAQQPDVHRVALFTLDLRPEMVADARAAGAVGFISKALSADAIADAIVRVAAGEDVVAAGVDDHPALDQLNWPGKDDGLSERESQVLILIGQGLTNKEIARSLYLSVETVKTYVRQVFAKLDVRNRTQAAAHAARTGAFARYQPVDPGQAGREPPER